MAEVSNVSAASPKIGGALYRAPKGTACPTDATTALNAAFKSLGYMSQDGFKNTIDIQSEEQKAWGGDVVNDAETGRTDTFVGTLIESLNVDVLKTVFGDANVTGSLAEGISVDVNGKKQEEACWVCDMVLREGAVKRIVIPDGKITALAEISYADNAPIGYGITVKAYADGNGSTHKEYIKKAQA